MTPDNDRLTFKETMAELRIGEDSLRELIRSGKGPGMYVGNTFLCYRRWVERWMSGQDGFWSVAIAGQSPAHLPAPYTEPLRFELVPQNGRH